MNYLNLQRNQIIQNSWISLTIFLVVFAIHFFSYVTTSTDSKWSVYTTLSIMREGNTDLDEYRELISYHGNHAIETIDDHIYTKFPVGASIIAIPFVIIVEKVLERTSFVKLDQISSLWDLNGIETLVAAIIIALSSIIIFHIAFLRLGNQKYAILIVFIFENEIQLAPIYFKHLGDLMCHTLS